MHFKQTLDKSIIRITVHKYILYKYCYSQRAFFVSAKKLILDLSVKIHTIKYWKTKNQILLTNTTRKQYIKNKKNNTKVNGKKINRKN